MIFHVVAAWWDLIKQTECSKASFTHYKYLTAYKQHSTYWSQMKGMTQQIKGQFRHPLNTGNCSGVCSTSSEYIKNRLRFKAVLATMKTGCWSTLLRQNNSIGNIHGIVWLRRKLRAFYLHKNTTNNQNKCSRKGFIVDTQCRMLKMKSHR